MKRISLLALSFSLLVLVLASCSSNDPVAPIPDSFPKKHLIEEFTSQECVYCPYGMDCVSAYIEDDPNWIVVLHHAGYAKDHFTVSGSSTIAGALSVNSNSSSSFHSRPLRDFCTSMDPTQPAALYVLVIFSVWIICN